MLPLAPSRAHRKRPAPAPGSGSGSGSGTEGAGWGPLKKGWELQLMVRPRRCGECGQRLVSVRELTVGVRSAWPLCLAVSFSPVSFSWRLGSGALAGDQEGVTIVRVSSYTRAGSEEGEGRPGKGRGARVLSPSLRPGLLSLAGLSPAPHVFCVVFWRGRLGCGLGPLRGYASSQQSPVRRANEAGWWG